MQHPETPSQVALRLTLSVGFLVGMIYIGCDEGEDGSALGKNGSAQTASSDDALLGPAAAFNVFALGSIRQQNTDIEGRLAAMGDIELSGFGVGAAIGSGAVLVAGGDVRLDNGQVNGDALHVGAFSGNANVRGATLHKEGVDFSEAAAHLQLATQELQGLPSNGAVTLAHGEVRLVGHDEALNVFTLDAATLASANGLRIDAPATSSVIVNVVGQSARLSGFEMFLGSVPSSRVLLNFPETLNLEVASFGVKGTILAPYAATEFDNGQIDGQLIVRNLEGTGESHDVPYDPPSGEDDETGGKPLNEGEDGEEDTDAEGDGGKVF